MTTARICDSCDQPLAIYRVCCIGTCTTPPTVHVTGYPDCAGLSDHADALAGLPEIVDQSTIDLASLAINAARAAVEAAAGYAAEVTAGVTASNAAWTAIKDAALAATGDVTADAAKAAGWAAARDALITRDEMIESASTRDELIESAHDLMDRMLKVTGA